MIEKLLALFERLVTAHERLAASQEALLQNCACAEPSAAAAPQPTAPQPEPAKVEDTAPVATAAAWNPYLEPVQGRYGKDKLNTLDAEIAERNIELKGSATGAEKHQALLDWAARGADAMPETATPVQEPAAPVEIPEEVTRDMVRALAQKAMSGTSKMDAKAIQDLFDKCAGVRRLPDIPEDKLTAVYTELSKTVEV